MADALRLCSSGTGTEADPYLISTAADLARMHDDLDGCYRLTANINMSGVLFEPVGNEREGAFTGTLTGTTLIYGPTVGGIVGESYGAVTDCTNSGAVSGHYAGGIVGCVNSGTITLCLERNKGHRRLRGIYSSVHESGKSS